ncbi:hypothetical protein GCM10010349_69520 [Streptomyces flavofungini]|nr:hypothetical protein GCM10010349_69520 [Streptomyces flavofungini]
MAALSYLRSRRCLRDPGGQRVRAAGHQATALENPVPVTAPGGTPLPRSAGCCGQRLGADRAGAGPGDRREALQRLPDALGRPNRELGLTADRVSALPESPGDGLRDRLNVGPAGP